MKKTDPWKCSACTAVVFIPDYKDIDGGVCTQERKGCAGEISKMSTDEALGVRGLMKAKGIREQPWLTLVFG